MLKLFFILGCLSLVMFIRASAHQLPHCFALRDDTCPNSNVTFWLYTNEHPHGSLVDPKTFENFDVHSPKPLKVLIHGFAGNHSSSPNRELLPQLVRIPDINILTLDYSKLVLDPCYTQSVHNAHFVGRCLAQFLGGLLHNRLVPPEQLHLIGFGMGAHVAGFAAKFMSQIQLKVAHITGLDPAKPLFLTPIVSDRLDSSDADFVDIIHTDVFLHGLMQPIGHVDFYPNKGVVQPNCGPIDDISTNQCYHRRAAEYYGESIYSPKAFWGFRCKDLYGFITGECKPNNDIELLGYYTRQTARGNYFLGTNDIPPYALGHNFNNLDRTLYGKTYLGDELIEKLKELGPDVRRLTTDI